MHFYALFVFTVVKWTVNRKINSLRIYVTFIMQPIRRHKRTQTHALYLSGSGLCCVNLDDLFLYELCDLDPQINVFYTSTPLYILLFNLC